MKKSILVLIDWFEPAFRAGGPITSCVNFVNEFSDVYNISILTSAYDLDGTIVVEEKQQSSWLPFGNSAKVYYAGKRSLNYRNLAGIIRDENPDYVYCNSMFSLKFSLFPLFLKLFKNTPAQLVLAPRGMLKSSALEFKALKKSLFLFFFKLSGIPMKIKFHATDEEERADIRKHFGLVPVFLAGNIPSVVGTQPGIISKIKGNLNMLFLGRIHPIKQLGYLLENLDNMQDKIKLTVIGPIEDSAYWQGCQVKINNLPGNISVKYIGEKTPKEVKVVLSEQHILALPTRGENFGHAIFEAFALGKPVVISNRTPWQNLEMEKTGFSLDLEKPEDFRSAIRFFSNMEQEEYNHWSKCAYLKAEKYITVSGLLSKYQQLFN